MKPWTFVHAADLQPGSPKSFRFRPAWRDHWQTAKRQILALDPDLLLIGGDLSADGWIHPWELEEIKSELDALPFPYHAVPGNMDTGNKHTDRCGSLFEERDDPDLNVTSEQLQRYVSILGPMEANGVREWSFLHQNVRFSGLYAAIAGSGLAEEQRMWEWLENLGNLPRRDHHVLIMHYALFIEGLHEPNYDITDPDQYLQWYFGMDEPHRSRIMRTFRDAEVDLVISGHIHCRKVDVVEGITFQKAPATCFSQMDEHWPDGDPTLGFLHYEVSDAGISPIFVPLERVSTAQGYGPGGHPRPELRDYSLAWEKGG